MQPGLWVIACLGWNYFCLGVGVGVGVRVGADETLSLSDPNTFPLKRGLHVVQIHRHLIQHSGLCAAPPRPRPKEKMKTYSCWQARWV